MTRLFPLLLVLVCTAVAASEYARLSGDYRLGGQTLYDPPLNEPQDTHLYFELTGSSAKDLYQALKVQPQRDACGERGTLTKRLGNIQCTQASDHRSFRCWFGVDIRAQRVVNGVVC